MGISDLETARRLSTLLFLVSPMADPSRDGRRSVTRFLLRNVTGRCEPFYNRRFRQLFTLGLLDNSDPGNSGAQSRADGLKN